MKTSPKIPPLIVILSLTAGLFLVSGCTKKEDTAPDTVTVYTAGYTRNTTNVDAPCYWKNETRIDLPVLNPSYNGQVNAIQVIGNTIYTAGYTEKNSINIVPCYWKNETRVDLAVLDPTYAGGVVESIQVMGDAVFTSGYTVNYAFGDYIYVPCYWINETRVDLPVLDPTQNAIARDIKIVENTIYTAGFVGKNFAAVPCYWLNDTLIVLSIPDPTYDGQATSIQVIGNDIYVAGYISDNFGRKTSCYWLNGNRTDIPLLEPYSDAQAYDIQVVGNTVYTAGHNGYVSLSFGRVPCYWVNKTRIDLSTPLPPYEYLIGGSGQAINVVENIVYTAGFAENSDNISVPSYWINEARIDLPVIDPSKSGEARAIQVVVK